MGGPDAEMSGDGEQAARPMKPSEYAQEIVLGVIQPGSILNSKIAFKRKNSFVQIRALSKCKVFRVSADKLEAMSIRPQFDLLKNNLMAFRYVMMDVSKSNFEGMIGDNFPAYDIIPYNSNEIRPKDSAKIKFKNAVTKIIQERRHLNIAE